MHKFIPVLLIVATACLAVSSGTFLVSALVTASMLGTLSHPAPIALFSLCATSALAGITAAIYPIIVINKGLDNKEKPNYINIDQLDIDQLDIEDRANLNNTPSSPTNYI